MIYTVTFIGLLAMLFASLPRKSFKYGLEVAWLIIFVFLAIRYDFGNDYMGYLESFNRLNSWDTFSVDTELHSEPGWQILCNIFKPIGFFGMVACITAFECYVIYRFIKEYVPERYYWFSIFIYVFTPSMMLIGASMMRQMLAIIFVLCSFKYISKRKIIPFVLLIFCASKFHSSAAILYPLFLLGYIKEVKTNRWLYCLITLAYMALFLVSDRLSPIINEVAILAGEEKAWNIYSVDGKLQEVGTGIGSVFQFCIFLYALFTLHKRDSSVNLLFLILIVGAFVTPFANVIYILGRFSYYFDIVSIVCYPIIWGGSKANTQLGYKPAAILSKQRIGDFAVISMVIMITIYGYLQFFKSPVWIEKYSTYHTIFML